MGLYLCIFDPYGEELRGVEVGMYHYFDLAGLDAKQPFGFDYLEPFVHHGSRVYRDFGAHVPVGVFQCLRFGDGC